MAALATLISTLLLTTERQIFTGDEPRYVLYSRSILSHGTFVMPLPDWQKFHLRITKMESRELPTGANRENFFNSVYIPTLLSPIAQVFELSGLRDTTLVVGLIGLFYLYRLCRRIFTESSALLSVALAGFSIPLLSYLHLFYMETYLFALICCGWERLQTRDRGIGGDLTTAIVLLAIPFTHLRASLIAGALYFILLYQLYSSGKTRRALALIALGAASMLALLGLNQAIYGSITGPVTGAILAPSQGFSYYSMQLFNLHHGLFAYAPVWLLGFAGLFSGAVRGLPLLRQGLVLAAIAALTSIGQDAGESWPARYWVPLIPMLAVGFCTWWSMVRGALPRLVAVILVAFTLVNTILFFRFPNQFLENRASTRTYQTLFDMFGHLNFGVVLPAPVDDATNSAAAEELTVGAALFILLMAAAAVRRNPAYAVGPLLMLFAAADLARVSVVKPGDYQADLQRGRVTINFDVPIKAAYVQLGRPEYPWYNWPDWQTFALTTTGFDGPQLHAALAANHVVAASCRGYIKTIEIDSPGRVDVGSEASSRLVVYRSNSWLRKSLTLLRKPC